MLCRYIVGAWLIVLGGVVAPVAARASPAAESAAPAQAARFATPEEAVVALIAAARADKVAALHDVLGPGSDALLYSGDPVSDERARQTFVAAYDTKHELAADARGRMVLTVGKNDWPLPIPVVKDNGQWHFDSFQGAQDLVDRRIGRNEIAAIRTALAYVDAQRLYFEMMRAEGAEAYAQRLVSRPGFHDGLYWPEAAGQPESPLAPLVEQAMDEGYPGANMSGKPVPYQGYYFRILTGQGDSAPGGALTYVADGRMTKGFALIAWPAIYGASGIMTFEVNQDDVVFQKDLGPATAALVAAIKLFDPGLSWARVRRCWSVAQCAPRYSVSWLGKGMYDGHDRAFRASVPFGAPAFAPSASDAGAPAKWERHSPDRARCATQPSRDPVPIADDAARRRVGRSGRAGPGANRDRDPGGTERVEIQSRAARRHAGADRALSRRSARANADGRNISGADR